MSAFEKYAARYRQLNEQRRALVLRHPDIARRLTMPPLGYAQPQQWTGYVPPERWNGEHNDSPRRAALAEIVAAAEAAERAHEIGPEEVF